MGGSLTVKGVPMLCEGNAVKKALDDVFAHPGDPNYKKAQDNKHLFYDIAKGTGSSQDLHDAYMAVGVQDSPNWKWYLGQLGPDNIKHIAMARFEGLDRTKPMKTITHDPAKGEGDHGVHWHQEADLSYTIDSPLTPDDSCP